MQIDFISFYNFFFGCRYLSATRKWVVEEIEKRVCYLHTFAWGVPFALSAVALIFHKVSVSDVFCEAEKLLFVCRRKAPFYELWSNDFPFWVFPRFWVFSEHEFFTENFKRSLFKDTFSVLLWRFSLSDFHFIIIVIVTSFPLRNQIWNTHNLAWPEHVGRPDESPRNRWCYSEQYYSQLLYYNWLRHRIIITISHYLYTILRVTLTMVMRLFYS